MSEGDRKSLAAMGLTVKDFAEGLGISMAAVSKGLSAQPEYLDFQRKIEVLARWEAESDVRAYKLRPALEESLRRVGLPLGLRENLLTLDSICSAERVLWVSPTFTEFSTASEVFRRIRRSDRPPGFWLAGHVGWRPYALDFLASSQGAGILEPLRSSIALFEFRGFLSPEALLTVDIAGRCRAFARGLNLEFFEISGAELLAGQLLSRGINFRSGELPAYQSSATSAKAGVRLCWFSPPGCPWAMLLTWLAKEAESDDVLVRGGGAEFLRRKLDASLRGDIDPVLFEGDLGTFLDELAESVRTDLDAEQAETIQNLVEFGRLRQT